MDRYNLKFKIILIVFMGFFIISNKGLIVSAQETSNKGIPNIIIITLNGVRNIESINDPTHQYIPNLWNKMFKEGTLYTDLIDENFEFHMPAVCAINTGVIYPAYSFVDPNLKAPSIFQYIRKKYGLPASKLWAIGHWKYDECIYETDDYSEDTYPYQFGWKYGSKKINPYLIDMLTAQTLICLKSLNELELFKTHWDSFEGVVYHFFKKIVQKFKPKFVHYVMPGVEIAHGDTFSKYVLSLKRSDQRIYETWQMIQSDPFYKDNTYLIVCIDHGRNVYYKDHYENAYDNPSHTWMYIFGPDIKKGAVIDRPVYHRDIFATAAYLMDVETHPTEGVVLKDCFQAK